MIAWDDKYLLCRLIFTNFWGLSCLYEWTKLLVWETLRRPLEYTKYLLSPKIYGTLCLCTILSGTTPLSYVYFVIQTSLLYTHVVLYGLHWNAFVDGKKPSLGYTTTTIWWLTSKYILRLLIIFCWSNPSHRIICSQGHYGLSTTTCSSTPVTNILLVCHVL